jgi:hypothetical protein
MVVEDLCSDRATFEASALRKWAALRGKRWLIKDHELFREGAQTFALSNQWSGPVVLPLIDQIARQLPELQISYTETDAGEDG